MSEPGVYESGWLIEAVGVSPAMYWDGRGWSSNHMEAVRFARREDAERAKAGQGFSIDCAIEEHGWHNPPPEAGC